MSRDWRHNDSWSKVGAPTASDALGTPGKQTLVDLLPAEPTSVSTPAGASEQQAASVPAPVQRKIVTAGEIAGGEKPNRARSLPRLQLRSSSSGGAAPGEHDVNDDVPAERAEVGEPGHDGSNAVDIAARGVEGGGGPLPHLAQIQASFGHHDVSSVQSHDGTAASAAASELGAEAYAFGSSVAFGRTPDLHTAAHEAAHVVQQRGGVQLKGGIDQPGDEYERHADAVADAVVAGRSAVPLLDQVSGGAQSASVVQRAPSKAASTASSASGVPAATGVAPAITPPNPGIEKPGFIDNSDGAYIRTAPREAGGTPVRATPLPPATRVFVSGTHPGAAEWWYVTVYLDGSVFRGYVQGGRVTVNLPEPLAKLHQVVKGDTAEKLAVSEYQTSVRDGHDLHYYENVLLYVNQHDTPEARAGITGTYQAPGILGDGGNNIQLIAGHRIWLVSPAYARQLEAVVPSGSLTGGAVAKVKRFAGHVQDILQSVSESRHHFGEVASEYAQAIRDHMGEIIGITGAFIAAEVASASLAISPTGIGQIAAALIQVLLAMFGTRNLAEAGIAALEHGREWLTLAWNSKGDKNQIAAASKEFLKMLVAIAAAALAYLGVKGSAGKALTIAGSTPTGGLPALAVANGGQLDGAASHAGVPLGPASPLGAAGAKMTKLESEGDSATKGDGAATSAATDESATSLDATERQALIARGAKGGDLVTLDRLVAMNPKKMRRLMRESSDQLIELLRTQLLDSPDAFESAIAKRNADVTAPVRGLYEATDALPEGWRLDRDVSFMEGQVRVVRSRVFGPNGAEGRFERAYNPKTGTLELREAFLKTSGEEASLPNMVPKQGTLPEMIAGRGTPTVQYITLHQMRLLGIPYGQTGGIRRMHLSRIQNLETIVHLHYLQKTLGGEPSALFEYTPTMRHVETTLTQSGYRRSGPVMITGGTYEDLDGLLSNQEQGNGRRVVENRRFMHKYGVERTTSMFWDFDVDFSVSPIQ